jgi:hypothetical protein
MIDRFKLNSGETYTFSTVNQYVVVVSLGNRLAIMRDNKTLAVLDSLETYSCPANSGDYTLAPSSMTDVLLVRYILI